MVALHRRPRCFADFCSTLSQYDRNVKCVNMIDDLAEGPGTRQCRPGAGKAVKSARLFSQLLLIRHSLCLVNACCHLWLTLI